MSAHSRSKTRHLPQSLLQGRPPSSSAKHRKTHHERLLEHDAKVSQKLAYCGNPVGLSWPLSAVYWLCKLLELSGHGVPWFLFAGFRVLTAIQREHIQFWCNVVYGLIWDLALICVIKSCFRRARPSYATQLVHHKISPDQFSFPSGHASRATMMTFLLYTQWFTQPWTKLLIVGWALIVCLSRTILGRHYASDVCAGALLGVTLGWIQVHFLWLPVNLCYWLLEPVHQYLFI